MAVCLSSVRRRRISRLATELATLLGPWEMGHWDHEEAMGRQHQSSIRSRHATNLLELSAIPASALYQARNAAKRPK